MIMTSSLDSTIKVFMTGQDKLKEEMLDFDAVETNITKICGLNKKHVISIGDSR